MDSKSEGDVRGDDDESPIASSRYSSCGDSEFDRYCSANSVTGTPSVRSSGSLAFNDFLDMQGFENFALGGNGEKGFEDSKIGVPRIIGSREFSELDFYGNDVGGFENFELGASASVERGFQDGAGSGDPRIGRQKSLEDRKIVFFERNRSRECSEVDLYGNDGDGIDDFGLGGMMERDVGDSMGSDNEKVELWRGSMNQDSTMERESYRMDVYGDGKVDFGRSSKSQELKIGCERGSVNLCGKKVSELDGGVSGSDGMVSEDDRRKAGSCEGSSSMDLEVSHEFKGVDMSGNQINEPDKGVVFVHGDGVASDRSSDGRERRPEEDETSSKYEYSEDENSMYNYDTGDEIGNVSYFPEGTQYNQETAVEDENPLRINTSVAFGSEDWKEFLRESEECNPGSEMSNNFEEHRKQNFGLEKRDCIVSKFESLNVTQAELVNGMESVSAECIQSLDSDALAEDTKISSVNHKDNNTNIRSGDVVHSGDTNGNLEEHSRPSSITSKRLSGIHRPGGEHGGNIFTSSQHQCDLVSNCDNLLEKNEEEKKGIVPPENSKKNVTCSINMENAICTSNYQNQNVDNLEPHVDSRPLFDANALLRKCYSSPVESPESVNTTVEEFKPNLNLHKFDDQLEKKSELSLVTTDLHETLPAQSRAQNLEINESYEDFVHEMEEILLDSVESPGVRYTEGNRIAQSQLSLPLRDGGSSASTSGRDGQLYVLNHPARIDGIEVIGAKQKKGSVSFSERLVGVKEYTLYRIRVWSGEDQWEVERRYRDFYSLYCQLKALFSGRGLSLPSSWSSVENESRKLFGNVSPDVIAERSTLIQDCLQSILRCRSLTCPPDSLISFLSPQEWHPRSPVSNMLVSHSTPLSGHAVVQHIPTLGKTISLVVEIQPNRSWRQMLEAQHYTCAGCHKHLNDGKTLMQDIMQTFGWAKPRHCEYTGQLFCSSCHTNDTAVLPARVLHHWDFTRYPVSQMAKSYLDSIHDKPMLCVSAVNPFLFSKVPGLHLVVGIRKKIANMMPYVVCPYRRSISKGLGSRRYILESNEFFALKDLIDLSKGVFSVLPVILGTLSSKIQKHITEQCLICCEKGVPCGAGQSCSDPSSLIFPFQEGEIKRCTACDLVFHESCFKRVLNCACGAYFGNAEGAGGVSRRTDTEAGGPFNLLRSSGSGLSMGLLSGLFSKSEKNHKDSDNVISLGSLPSNLL